MAIKLPFNFSTQNAEPLDEDSVVFTDANGDTVTETGSGTGEVSLSTYIQNNPTTYQGQLLFLPNAGAEGRAFVVTDVSAGEFKRAEPTFETGFEATETIGGLSSGTTFDKGDPLQSAIIAMFFSYTGPNLSFSYGAGNTVEAGATQSNSVDTTWTENDAGDVTDIRMYREGSTKTLNNAPSLPSSGDFSFSESVSETETTSTSVGFSIEVDYDEGPVQNGVSNPPGPGTLTSNVNLYWRFRYWTGVNQLNNGFDLTAGTPSSSEVRGLPNSALNVGGSISQNNVDGNGSAEIAIENGRSASSLEVAASGFTTTYDLSSVSTGENVFSDGSLWYRTPDVYLADGSTLKTYNVYQWVPTDPFPSDTDLTWSL